MYFCIICVFFSNQLHKLCHACHKKIDIYAMRIVFYCFILTCYISFTSKAQDSIMFSKDFILYEGLYINYQEFRVNWPISKDKILTSINKDQLDFYSKLLEQDFIEYKERDGSVVKIKSDKVWGYCQNNIIFINLDKNFCRIPIFGAICNFIGTVEVASISQNYDPFMNAPINSTQTKTREIRHFLFDFYSGEISPFTIEKTEELLKRDDIVYKEYMLQSKKKKKDFANKYIRMYNERHPVYFPKN